MVLCSLEPRLYGAVWQSPTRGWEKFPSTWICTCICLFYNFSSNLYPVVLDIAYQCTFFEGEKLKFVFSGQINVIKFLVSQIS